MQFKSLGYYILKLLTWPMQLFPMQFHYFVSDVLCFLIYRIAKYRLNVVRENLANSFPQKSYAELLQIEKDFYYGFSDMFIETLYFTHINLKKNNKRLILNNIGDLTNYISQGRNVIVVAGHFGNWEFMQLFAKKIEINKFFVYKRLNNKAFDRFYRDLRSRAAQPLEMKQTARVLLSENNHPFAAYFISDQRPVPEEIKYWVNFMNQETPVMLGTEKIARKTNSVVVYLEVEKIKRGYHQANFITLFENATETLLYEITDKFFEMLEQSIKKSPDQYFWTHKRWKYKREMFTK